MKTLSQSLNYLKGKEATVAKAKFAMVKWKKMKLEWVAGGQNVKMTWDFTLRPKDIERYISFLLLYNK